MLSNSKSLSTQALLVIVESQNHCLGFQEACYFPRYFGFAHFGWLLQASEKPSLLLSSLPAHQFLTPKIHPLSLSLLLSSAPWRQLEKKMRQSSPSLTGSAGGMITPSDLNWSEKFDDVDAENRWCSQMQKKSSGALAGWEEEVVGLVD